MKQKRNKKLISFLLILTLLFQTTAFSASFAVQSIANALEESGDTEAEKPPTSLDDVKIPEVTQNPYNVKVEVETFPIYNDKVYKDAVLYDLVSDVARWVVPNKDQSPYYTAAISPMYSYKAYRSVSPDEEITLTSNLPYRETNSKMFQPDLVLKSGTLTVDTSYAQTGGKAFDFLNHPYVKSDQSYLRLGATLLSESGTISDGKRGSLENKVSGEVTDEPVKLTLDLPLSSYDHNTSTPTFNVRYGSMTDMHMVLIDNTSPTVEKVSSELDWNAGELSLYVNFTEQLRWAHDFARGDLDDLWVEVYLSDLTSGGGQTLRMYLSELDGNRLVFRGQLGDFKYKDFTIDKVTNASLKSTFRMFEYGVVDVVKGIYVSPYDYVSYNNGFHGGEEMLLSTTAITDHAGNALNILETINWELSRDTYMTNAFDAKEVKIYNEHTVNTLKEVTTPPTDWPEDINRSQLFAGPGNELTVQIFTEGKLTNDECKKVTAVLNINNKDGTPLKVKCTSSYRYVPDEEVYGNGTQKPLTVLLFEDIELEEGMTLVTAEGEAPQIKVITWEDEIDDKEAYPNIVAPSRQLYGDFSKPIISGKLLQTLGRSDTQDHNSLSAEITLDEDVSDPTYFSGVMTTEADFFLGGTVVAPINVKYVISDSPTPPENASDYTHSAVIPVNGESYLGTKPVTSESVKWYLHMITEGDSILIDDIYVRVTGEDIVGNTAERRIELEWQVDEIAPTAYFKGKRVEFVEDNTAANVTVSLAASDYNQVASLKYRWAGAADEYDPSAEEQTVEWLTAQIEPGANVTTTISKTFGGLHGEDILHTEMLLVKVADLEGNESEPIGFYVVVSTEKPDTYVEINTDVNIPTTKPELIVTGPPALIDGTPAYTRVMIAPAERYSGWSMEYVTVVKTGERVNLFDFTGDWWRVSIFNGKYDVVTKLDPYDPTNAYLDDADDYYTDPMEGWDEIVHHYGALKITFENGYEGFDTETETYKNMIPVEGQYLYENMAGASYMADPNYYVIRYASRSTENKEIHEVTFEDILDREGNEVWDGTYSTPRINATKKNVNPMRNMQIFFSIENIAKRDWALMDIDFARSHMELHQVVGETDKVIVSQTGLAGTASQYFTIPNLTDDGEEFVTGAYYLSVTIVSKSGAENTYDSIRIMLDAETVKNDGLWNYSLTPYASNVIGSLDYHAESEPFRSIGMSVATSHEVMRSNLYAVYTGGVSSYTLKLSVDQNASEYDVHTLGAVEGFRYWNMLSAPTDEELAAQQFYLDYECEPTDKSVSLEIYSRADKVYTADTIPKGSEGFSNGRDLYLVKGVNTICYQVKMENGYISPVRQITVIVSEHLPKMNMAIDTYVPSHEAAQIDGMVNAHSITYFLEYAYSLNGSGEVDVRTYSTYELEVNGKMTTDPYPEYLTLDLMASNMQIEDTVTLTENSYTSEFADRDRNIMCTAAFIAIDEYGGVTVVAPQLGDKLRYGNSEATVDGRYNIDYNEYQTDPYTGDSLTYGCNIPVYYGKQVIRFENTFSVNYGDAEVIETSVPELMYNLFNISTNSVEWGGSKYAYSQSAGAQDYWLNTTARFDNGTNLDLINWDSAQITFSGGGLADTVTVPLGHKGANDAGFIDAYYSLASDYFALSVASMPREGIFAQTFSVDIADRALDPETDTDVNTIIKGRVPTTITFTLPGSTEAQTFNYVDTDGVSLFYENDLIVYLNEGVATGFAYQGNRYDLSTESAAFAGIYTALIESTTRSYTIEGYNIFGDYFEYGSSLPIYFTEYEVVSEGTQDHVAENADEYYGVILYFSMESVETSDRIKTGLMNGGRFNETLTDYYGNKHTFDYTIGTVIDKGTDVKFSTLDNTASDVTVEISRSDGNKIHVDIIDYAVMSVEGNDTSSVKVTLKDNIVFSYRYLDSNGDERIVKLNVKNIIQPSPRLIWDCDLNDTVVDENGAYRYGTVTVTLIDSTFDLIDQYTGELPSFTFYPGGESTYVFEADSIIASLGDEQINIPEDIWVELPFELREVEDPLNMFDPITGERLEDNETPNAQILAYSNQNGYYAEEHLALRLISGRGKGAFAEYPGYETIEYVGNRGNASELLARMAWATVYRFEIEVIDMSRTRLFVKQGLYCEAPDYETGYSDNIPGVTLYSRLLSVSEAATFTLFIVDEGNHYTSIAFDVNNVGKAPFASTVKIPQEYQETVRVYVIPPEDDKITEFEVYSLDTGVKVARDEDSASQYYGYYYVEYSENDDYIINYRYKYDGTPIEHRLNTTVYEINHREIALAKGGIKWSDNKTFESTDQAVTAQITLTEKLYDLQVIGTYDESKVTYEIAGNTVLVTYSDNHDTIVLSCIAENGTFVYVTLDAVTNIDKAAPILTVSKALAANGKSMILTITSNERAIFREGGYVGELKDSLYYYTRTITENGKYVYHFTDMAGTVASIEVEVTELVKDALAMWYSLSAEGTDAVNDPGQLEVKIGDTVYLKPSRNATAQINEGEAISLDAGQWTPITITESMGGILPYLIAEDQFGNVLTHQFSRIIIPDGTAPTLAIERDLIAIKVGTDREEVKAMLFANLTAFDDDTNLTYDVEFPEDLSLTGVFNVVYKVTDSAGNVGTEIGKLRILAGAEPVVTIDGSNVYRDATHILKTDADGKIVVDVEGRGYSVSIKSGIKTVAQMKIGSTNLATNVTGTEPIDLGELEAGYYTLCILTQDRDYFRLILYVE